MTSAASNDGPRVVAWQQDDAAGNTAITEAGGIEFAVNQSRNDENARRSSRSRPFQFSAALIDQGQHLGARRIGRSGSSAATLPSA